jgi:hypothetical protein
MDSRMGPEKKKAVNSNTYAFTAAIFAIATRDEVKLMNPESFSLNVCTRQCDVMGLCDGGICSVSLTEQGS